MKVYLSPSDQWSNKVATGEHSEAYHCNLIAHACYKHLLKNGYDVKVGDNTKEKSYTSRVRESNTWGADLHVCIHTNAGGGHGTLVMSYPSSCNNKYVEAIYKAVADLTPTVDKGIQPKTDLYEIANTRAVCCYVEVDFHDNVTIENWIDSHVDDIGKAIAQGICNADGKSFNTGDSVVETPNHPSVLYRVQCGAFRNRDNAKQLSYRLTNSGFNNFILFDNSSTLYKVQCGAFASKKNAEKLVTLLKLKGYDCFIKRG